MDKAVLSYKTRLKIIKNNKLEHIGAVIWNQQLYKIVKLLPGKSPTTLTTKLTKI